MVASTVIGASASRQNGWSGGGKAPLPAASGAPWQPRTPGGPDVDHIAHRERRRRPQRRQRAAIGHGCVPVWSVKIVPASRVAAAGSDMCLARGGGACASDGIAHVAAGTVARSAPVQLAHSRSSMVCKGR